MKKKILGFFFNGYVFKFKSFFNVFISFLSQPNNVWNWNLKICWSFLVKWKIEKKCQKQEDICFSVFKKLWNMQTFKNILFVILVNNQLSYVSGKMTNLSYNMKCFIGILDPYSWKVFRGNLISFPQDAAQNVCIGWYENLYKLTGDLFSKWMFKRNLSLIKVTEASSQHWLCINHMNRQLVWHVLKILDSLKL